MSSVITRPSTRTPRIDQIPEELRLGLWCVWKASPSGNDEIDKVSHQLDAYKYKASTNKPNHWSSFDQADRIYKSHSAEFNGLGRLVRREDRIVYVDHDDCVLGVSTQIRLEDWTRKIGDHLDTYTELSPSRKGLRIVARSDVNRANFTNAKIWCGNPFRKRRASICDSNWEGSAMSRPQLRVVEPKERDTVPRPVKPGERAVARRSEEIDQWIESRVRT